MWGLLAVAGWLAVLVPTYLVIDNGPAMVQALFGDDERTLAEPTATELNNIAPAAGGND